MPQVPYSPVPTVAPESRPTPQLSSGAATGAAFGENVANAISGLGKTLEGAGREIFSRAIAMQQLNNETDAKNADIDFMMKAGDLHAKYNSLQGQDRVTAFPKYSTDLQELYQTSRATLSNPSAQKMFDGTAVSLMSRSIFNGAGAAATAQKEGALTAANAEYDLTTKQVYTDPNDETGFREAIKRNRSSAGTRAALMAGGHSPEREELIGKTGDNNLAYHRIIGMAVNQPYQASQLLEKYKAEGLIWGQQAETAENKVRSFTHSTGMTVLADQVLGKYRQPDGTFSKSFAELQAEAKSQATKLYPNDPSIGTAAVAALDRNYNQIKWAATQDRQDVTKQMNDYIAKGTMQVGQLPPELVQRMDPTQVKQFPIQANLYRSAIDRQTDQAAYTRLLGMYNNDNGKFMDTSIMEESGLSKANMQYFMGLQRKQQSGGDPRVERARNWIRNSDPAVLQDLKIFSRIKGNEDDYDKYTGALHEAIQAWQETNGKAPNEKEVTKEIFPAVVKQITEPGFFSFFGTTNQIPFFKSAIPDGAKSAMDKDAGRELNDIEARKEYTRAQFMKFYSDQKAKRSKDQGRVP